MPRLKYSLVPVYGIECIQNTMCSKINADTVQVLKCPKRQHLLLIFSMPSHDTEKKKTPTRVV